MIAFRIDEPKVDVDLQLPWRPSHHLYVVPSTETEGIIWKDQPYRAGLWEAVQDRGLVL